MSYSTIAQNIRNKASALGEALTDIENINFDNIWAGSAHDTQTSNLTSSINTLKEQQSNAIKLADALDDLQIYKDNTEKIAALVDILRQIPNTTENSSTINSYNNQIGGLESSNFTLKRSIDSVVNSISPVNIQFDLVSYEPTSNYKEYVVDLAEMLALFQSGVLTKLSDNNKSSDSLYDYYSKDQVESMITNVKQQYSGRDAAVNCALGVMQMAANVGIKLDYDFGGGHTDVTTLDAVASGVDCSSFASWAINQGATDTFNTRGTSSLISVGERISYEDAQKGDILVYSKNGEGHVVMIVDNDPETQQFLVVEASGSKSGVIMKTRSYASLSGTYQARDLSSIYND